MKILQQQQEQSCTIFLQQRQRSCPASHPSFRGISTSCTFITAATGTILHYFITAAAAILSSFAARLSWHLNILYYFITALQPAFRGISTSCTILLQLCSPPFVASQHPALFYYSSNRNNPALFYYSSGSDPVQLCSPPFVASQHPVLFYYSFAARLSWHLNIMHYFITALQPAFRGISTSCTILLQLCSPPFVASQHHALFYYSSSRNNPALFYYSSGSDPVQLCSPPFVASQNARAPQKCLSSYLMLLNTHTSIYHCCSHVHST